MFLKFFVTFFISIIVNQSFVFANERTQNFLFLGGHQDDLDEYQKEMEKSDGIQMIYTWKSLEPKKGKYDFSSIESDLNKTKVLGKKLFIQIQDRFFDPNSKLVPTYLLTDQEYNGGVVKQIDHPGEGLEMVAGWVAQQWNPFVQNRYQLLLSAIAKKFDGKIYGINLPETSIDIDFDHDKTGFSCDAYFKSEIENIAFTRQVFKKSHVVQYVNFFPCEWKNDHFYMSRFFEFAIQNNIGVGGPDVIPYHKSQMENSYPFFEKFKNQMTMISMAVQEPDLTYTNPETHKKYSKEEFESFAVDKLGAKIIFWSPSIF